MVEALERSQVAGGQAFQAVLVGFQGADDVVPVDLREVPVVEHVGVQDAVLVAFVYPHQVLVDGIALAAVIDEFHGIAVLVLRLQAGKEADYLAEGDDGEGGEEQGAEQAREDGREHEQQGTQDEHRDEHLTEELLRAQEAALQDPAVFVIHLVREGEQMAEQHHALVGKQGNHHQVD